MKRILTTFWVSVFLITTFSSGAAFADWQSTLENNFPFAQTFNDLNDWQHTGSSGDVTSSSLMPIETATGNVGVWRYYSTWVAPVGTPAIQNHGSGYTVNPWGESKSKSLLIDLGGGKGPSRLAADIRTKTYPNGFKWSDGVRVFYAMRRDSGFWTSSPTGYSKEFVLNMECNDSSCSAATNSGANYAISPYFDYHMTHENGVNPAVLISNATHDYIRESGTRTDMRIYNDKWIFVEYLLTEDLSNKMAKLSGWIYNSDGKLLETLYNDISASYFTSSEWSSSSSGYFDNAMFGGNMYSTGPKSQIYFDDLVIDTASHGSIADRYFKLAAGSNSTVILPPPNVKIE